MEIVFISVHFRNFESHFLHTYFVCLGTYSNRVFIYVFFRLGFGAFDML
jgi:hypothetical protein